MLLISTLRRQEAEFEGYAEKSYLEKLRKKKKREGVPIAFPRMLAVAL